MSTLLNLDLHAGAKPTNLWYMDFYGQ